MLFSEGSNVALMAFYCFQSGLYGGGSEKYQSDDEIGQTEGAR